jgi:hypothetical protein
LPKFEYAKFCSCSFADLTHQGIAPTRQCTDVPCLFLFLTYWGGMIYVGISAHQQGHPAKILHGLDSFGNYCGTVNMRGNVTIDLSDAPNLYYLNPLELLDAANHAHARAVCVPECPSALQHCAPGNFPCSDAENFVCPYYGLSQFAGNVADQLEVLGLDGSGAEDTTWWGALPALQETACVDSALLATILKAVADAFGATESCAGTSRRRRSTPALGLALQSS